MNAPVLTTPTAVDLDELCKAFNVENKSPDALLWLVVTALAIWGESSEPGGWAVTTPTLRKALARLVELDEQAPTGFEIGTDPQWANDWYQAMHQARQALAQQVAISGGQCCKANGYVISGDLQEDEIALLRQAAKSTLNQQAMNTTNLLSPAAQAVLEAYETTAGTSPGLAAALRAIAPQMEYSPDHIKLQAIATELEQQP